MKTQDQPLMLARNLALLLVLLLVVCVTNDLYAQSCTASSNTIEVTVDEADPSTFLYRWLVTNHDTGVGNRLEKVYFEIDTAVYSGASVAVPTWSDASVVVDSWNAIEFVYNSGTNIFASATQTFTYSLDRFVGGVRVRTIQKNQQQEDFLQFQNLENGCPLPVELAWFEGIADGNTVTLSWETVSETDLSGFGIEKRTDGSFEEIGYVHAFGGSGSRGYHFNYETELSRLVQFRLKIIDRSGEFDYSPVVDIAAHLPSGAVVSKVFPNPFQREANIQIRADVAQEIRVELFDILGRRVSVAPKRHAAAGEEISVALDALEGPAGLYVVRVQGRTFQSSQTVLMAR